MRILEIGWLCVAAIALLFGCYKVFGEGQRDFASYFLFLVAALGIFLFIMKRFTRKLLMKQESAKKTDQEDVAES